ncbi:MAG: site-specific DNA-methyltransferase [Gemmatales bacterium]|nr:MAG: site-specific DNA-methyltransferase [Gemmatales bacterium]
MSQKFEKLIALLKELFQLDQPDLDFGLYRIMHAKADEIIQFLDHDLLPQVQEAFSQFQSADKAMIEKELQELRASIERAGMDPAQSPKVRELEEVYQTSSVNVDALESEIYDHLYQFFRRYYHEGDFISLRRYKEGVYAIPYEGEEVKLYWANHDQYYIKTSEYLREYSFQCSVFSVQSNGPPQDDDDHKGISGRVSFRLVDAAEGEHGNVKENNKRVFVLASGDDFVTEQQTPDGNELVIRFEYRPATLTDWPEEVREGKKSPPAQKDLTEIAEARILEKLKTESLKTENCQLKTAAAWHAALSRPAPTQKDPDRPLLAKHLAAYVARNTFDYFIHKDLGGFLRRELDFYIKNEVMHLDDIENESAPRVEQYLSKIKVIRRIAGKIIDFLAQLEDFQKKLWLKKKFVTETNWCVRLGVICQIDDEAERDWLLEQIAANDAQREEWDSLKFSVPSVQQDGEDAGTLFPADAEELKTESLKTEHYRTAMIDTRHFDAAFTARLLDALGDIDEQTDGVLFHSENFQALSLFDRALSNRVQTICLDPPYNTGEDGFAYKDRYPHSSWITMMENRFSVALHLLNFEGVAFVSIDDTEYKHLWHVLGDVFGTGNYLGSMVWKRRSASAMSSQPLSLDHEYVLVFGRDSHMSRLYGLSKSEDDYPYLDDTTGLRYASTDLTIGMTREQRPNQFYPITNPRTGRVFHPNPNRVWRFYPETMQEVIARNLVIWPDEAQGNLERPRYKTYFDPESMRAKPCSSWIETSNTNDREVLDEETEYELAILQCGMNSEGGRVVDRIFGVRAFAYPKPLSLVRSLVRSATRNKDVILDYFAGSGTTGHAVINLNREDGGRRKFILVEMGDYFDTVLLPRLKKVTFSPEWKDGKPKRLATDEEAERSPRIIKYVRLESYEDTLNNLQLKRTDAQRSLLEHAEAQGPDRLREQYMLRYMLDVETRGSQSLLNIAQFTDPTAYTLNVKRPGSDESRETNVDLIETFNWLIGLVVDHIAAPQCFTAKFERDKEGRLRVKGRLRSVQCSVFSVQEEDGAGRKLKTESLKTENCHWFRTVTGTTRDGRKTLVIWRNRPGGEDPEGVEQDNLVLDEWFTKQGYSSKDSEFDLIYVNGTNNLENLRAPDDTWKVRLIEDDFHRLMFAEAEA